ncbi:hypothetical protein [uncultured Jatrophihabitans sp.]|uniref:hypothetical protein n=1 Tax=uncultured Jatrophihabitans sp. TaxID=1610747 RepID=UPI0035CBBC41
MTSGNRPAPEQGSWQIPGAASPYQAPSDAPRGDRRGRPGLVALIVALTEVVIIAAVGNQAVSKHASRYLFDHPSTFLGRAVGSSLQLAWRVKPLSADNHNGTHALYSQFLTIAVFVVLSAFLAAVATRGPITFWRAFFGIWTGVVAAICVARIIGGLVTRSTEPNLDRITGAFFSTISNLTVFAGLVIGLITALLAALVAASTRRDVDRPAVAAAMPEPAYVPESPPPFYGNAAQPHPQQQPQPAGYEETDGRTMQIPRFDPRGGQQWTPPTTEGQDTQALPRSTDDDRRG